MTSVVRARVVMLGALAMMLVSLLAPAATVAQDARTAGCVGGGGRDEPSRAEW